MARAVYTLTGLALLGVVLYALRGVLTPVFVAFLLAYMLDPLVDRFEAFRCPRSIAIAVLLLAVLLVVGLFLLLAAPAIVRDVSMLIRELPVALGQLLETGRRLLEGYGVEVPRSAQEVFERFQGDAGTLPAGALQPVKTVLSTLLGGTASALGALAASVMVPIFTFYLLQDFDNIVARVHELLPEGLRGRATSMAREVDEVLGQFFRGQLTVMLILAVLYGVGYSLVGVRLALPIGVVAGLLSFIPYLGGGLALGLALLMTALHFVGWGQVVAVVAVYGVIQILEGFVITPRIVGDKLGLAPVWVLFALMVGGELFGFMGVMLSLPAAAVVKVFVLRGIQRYRQSQLFRGGAPAPDAPPQSQPVDPSPVAAPVSPSPAALRRIRPRRPGRRARLRKSS